MVCLIYFLTVDNLYNLSINDSYFVKKYYNYIRNIKKENINKEKLYEILITDPEFKTRIINILRSKKSKLTHYSFYVDLLEFMLGDKPCSRLTFTELKNILMVYKSTAKNKNFKIALASPFAPVSTSKSGYKGCPLVSSQVSVPDDTSILLVVSKKKKI